MLGFGFQTLRGQLPRGKKKVCMVGSFWGRARLPHKGYLIELDLPVFFPVVFLPPLLSLSCQRPLRATARQSRKRWILD